MNDLIPSADSGYGLQNIPMAPGLAIMFNDRVYSGVDGVVVGDVASHGDDVVGVGDAGRVQVQDADSCASGDELGDHGRTDPGRAARDDGNEAIEVVHVAPLKW